MEEDSRDGDSKDEPEEDVSHRTWGAASGQGQNGYHANGYQNGYSAGKYDASAVKNEDVGPTGDHSYIGCLGLSNYELEHEWKFSGSPPACSYVHHSKKKKSKKNKSADAADVPITCTKSNWFSSCSNSTKNQTHTSWYKNHWASTSKSNQTTNDTATYESYGGAEGEDGPEQEGEDREGEDGPDEDENAEEDGPDDEESESDSQDGEPDDDTVLTNEQYENVNGNDYVYEKDTKVNGTAKNKTGWWSQWGHKSATNATNSTEEVQADGVANDMEDEMAEGEAEGEERDQEAEDNGFDPYTDFDLEQCDTYENLWLWDLSLTCKNSKSLDGCECSYAEELLFEGTISCDDFSLCPSECSVCRTCFQLLGCVKSHHEASALSSGGGYAGVLVGAMMFVLVGGAGYYIMRRRRKDSGDLGIHLMWRELGSDKDVSDTDSNDSGAWGAQSPRPGGSQQSSDHNGLFDDYYKSMDEGNAERPMLTRTQQRQLNTNSTRRPAIQLNNQGETDTLGDGTASVLDVDNSSTDDSDDSSRSSDYDSTLDGSTGDETGAQKIWLAPVDVALPAEEEKEAAVL